MPSLITWEDDTGQTQVIRFDAIFSESHEALNVITEHPVEEGANVADHVRDELDRVSLVGFVSNKPLWSNPGVEEFMDFSSVELDIPDPPLKLSPGLLIGEAIDAGVGALTGALGAGNSATVLNGSDFRNRVREMQETLKGVKAEHREVRVETGVEDYDNMQIERIGTLRTVQDGDGATFTIDLKQIRKVSNETVQAPVPAEARGQLPGAKGSKAAEASKNDDKKSEEARSIAAQLFDGAGNALGGLF